MKKVFLSVLLAITALLGLLGFAACGEKSVLVFSEQGIVEGLMTYEVKVDQDDMFDIKEVEIPKVYNDGKVTAIAERAFRNSTLEKITIPDTIETIGAEAFRDTKLSQIIYKGTKEQWYNIQKGEDWNKTNRLYKIKLSCTDGEDYV